MLVSRGCATTETGSTISVPYISTSRLTGYDQHVGYSAIVNYYSILAYVYVILILRSDFELLISLCVYSYHSAFLLGSKQRNLIVS